MRRMLSMLLLLTAASIAVPAASALASPAPGRQQFGVRLFDVPLAAAHNPGPCATSSTSFIRAASSAAGSWHSTRKRAGPVSPSTRTQPGSRTGCSSATPARPAANSPAGPACSTGPSPSTRGQRPGHGHHPGTARRNQRRALRRHLGTAGSTCPHRPRNRHQGSQPGRHPDLPGRGPRRRPANEIRHHLPGRTPAARRPARHPRPRSQHRRAGRRPERPGTPDRRPRRNHRRPVPGTASRYPGARPVRQPRLRRKQRPARRLLARHRPPGQRPHHRNRPVEHPVPRRPRHAQRGPGCPRSSGRSPPPSPCSLSP